MKLSEKVYEYISDTMNYDMNELMDGLVENIDEMKYNGKNTVSLDECSVMWGNGSDGYLMSLDDYTKRVFKEAVDRVVNVIRSFEEEEDGN